MAYDTQYTLSQDAAFKVRVRMAVLDYCMDVESEASSTANHSARIMKAAAVVQSPDAFVSSIAELICAHDSGLTGASADSAIKNDVASVWNLLAGV